MKLLKNKKFYVSILIDFSFLAILYFFVLFILKKVQTYALMLQGFGGDLSNIESVMQTNMSMLDYNLLLSNLDIINQVMQKILFLFFVLLVGCFLLYCLFQGIQWSFILKNFKKYFGKFSLVSFFVFSLSLLFLYYIFLNIRNIFINYFAAVSIFGLVIKVILLFVLLLILWYYTSVCYVLLDKYKLIKALKKTFLLKNLKSVLVYLGCFILIMLILFLLPIFNLVGMFWLIIQIILILFVVNYFRYYLVEILKKY